MWSEITAIDLDRRRSKVNCQPPETSQTVKSNDGLCVIQKWKWQLKLFFLFWSNCFLFLASDESPSSKPHRKRQSRLFLMFTFEMEIAERSRVHCSSSCEQVKAAMWAGGGGMDGLWWRRGTERAALQRTGDTASPYELHSRDICPRRNSCSTCNLCMKTFCCSAAHKDRPVCLVFTAFFSHVIRDRKNKNERRSTDATAPCWTPTTDKETCNTN